MSTMSRRRTREHWARVSDGPIDRTWRDHADEVGVSTVDVLVAIVAEWRPDWDGLYHHPRHRDDLDILHGMHDPAPGRSVTAVINRLAATKADPDVVARAAVAHKQCRECGCTDLDACPDDGTGRPCSWAGLDICSRCNPPQEGLW